MMEAINSTNNSAAVLEFCPFRLFGNYQVDSLLKNGIPAK